MTVRAAGLIVYRKMSKGIQYLLMQCSFGNHWTPPKGHVDPGENDMETAIRETKEEAGIDSTHLKILTDCRKELNYIVKHKPKVVVYWLAELLDSAPEVQLSHEHKDYRWVLLEEALLLTSEFPNQQEMFKECENYIKINTVS